MEYLIDALEDFCPIPNLKVQDALSRAQAGDQIMLLTDHSCTVTTIKEEMRRRRLRPKVEEVENGIWQITITVD